MYIKKNFSLKEMLRFSGMHAVWLTLWATAATCFIEYLHYLGIFAIKVPWLPVSLVGTAVAFYVGFKNNSAYDRLWEARKIWGGIVNTSRMWGSSTRSYISNQFTETDISESDLHCIHKRMIYRHIAWLYALRSQLLVPTSWEHVTQGKGLREQTLKRQKTWGIGLLNDETTQTELTKFLPEEEITELIHFKNTATQIIDKQCEEIRKLRKQNLVDDFRVVELQNLMNEMYTLQGKCERIKKFPLPRQYGSMSVIFTGLFLFLLPFGLITEFHDLSEWGAWLSIPFTVIVGWVFMLMELIGDYSENPFEGLGNDIPMLALCRTIEIDLKEMLGEENIPAGIEPKNGVLM